MGPAIVGVDGNATLNVSAATGGGASLPGNGRVDLGSIDTR